MRYTIALSVLIGALAPTSASAEQPYEGVWGAAKADCSDRVGTNRMTIKGRRFGWYETQCRVENMSQGRGHWIVRMACQGEGEKWHGTTRLSLPSQDRLVMENSPVGPTKRQVYIRCSR
jgi:hypothetical protein